MVEIQHAYTQHVVFFLKKVFVIFYMNMNQIEIQSYPENWREIDHPFYRLVVEVLDGKGAASFFDKDSLVPEDEFWGGNHPKEIILATGSTRKSLMMSRVLNGIEIPLDKTMAFQDFLVGAIHNGDGSLEEKTLLGEFHGVPVFAESAAPGETEGNNPQQEAKNKAYWLADQPQYQDGDYLFISTDTVDFVDLNKDGKLSEGEHGLGKPMNHPKYPTENKLMGLESNILRSIGEQIHKWQKTNFDRKYIEENFELGADLVHTNAIAIVELLANGEQELFEVWEAIIQSSLDSNFFDTNKVNPDQGGGGASQQNQDWESADALFESLDSNTQAILADLAGQDPVFFKFLVMDQINGMPAMNILHGIEQWALAKQKENSLEKGEEVVVFRSKES
ncbi:hypothetical protein HN662_05430 [Candidatus Woesearchaeota archaeon]|nr:hypothetical protein [Candidatus Woesearchaeota archaeon]